MPTINKVKLKILKLARPFLKLRSYVFDANRYKGSFISKYDKKTAHSNRPAPMIIYGFWTGDNELTSNRKKCIEQIKKNADIDFYLITPTNISDYIIENHPLHPAFDYLSLNHRSDYLRCYFMHYHGGGYIDIKEISKSWKKSFNVLNSKSNKWIIGYPELAPSTIPKHTGVLGKDLRSNYFRLIGNGGFICKPVSPFTTEWIKLVEDFLSSQYEQLKLNPGNTFGSNDGYPLPWASVQGAIFHPLCLKYQEYILQCEDLQMSFENYK